MSRPVTDESRETLLRALSPELVAAVERLVDERVEARLAECENGSKPPWLTISDAAEYLRVSPSTIGRMLKQGRVSSTYVGRRRLISRKDIDGARFTTR